jgi:hypothetical protein
MPVWKCEITPVDQPGLEYRGYEPNELLGMHAGSNVERRTQRMVAGRQGAGSCLGSLTNMIEVCGREVCIEGRVLRIAHLHGDTFRFIDDPASLVNGLQACGARVDLFTFAQRLSETKPKFSYPVEWENAAMLPVSTFQHWWTHQLRSYPRNRARQAEKRGVILRETPFDDSLVAGIREIYNECPIRQRRRFPHYGKDFETVRREEATFLDSSIFIGAYFEDKLIGFVKLVPDETRTQAGLMNILSMVKHKDKAPTNALIAHAVRACASRGIQHLVYSKFDYGKERDSLRDFKERNAFRRVDTPRYYVPLTALGRAALLLGLHHRMSERIPDAVASRLRALRSVWYERRYRSMVEEY